MILIKNFFFIALLLFLFSSCSSVMVSQDYDPSASFSQFDTFSFIVKDPNRKTDPRYDNELINDRFYRTIATELEKKGYIHNENKEISDISVTFDYSVGPKMDLYNINRQVGFSYGSYSRYGGIGAKTCTDISEFDQGILFINIKDTATGKLIWRGTGTDIVSIYATPDKINNQVEKMVVAVLENFPPE